jgi:hypothetical protein
MIAITMLRAACALLAGAALAAHGQPAKSPDPADAKAAVPPQIPPSSLQRFKPLQEQTGSDWRAANERLRPATPPSPAASAPPHAHHHH